MNSRIKGMAYATSTAIPAMSPVLLLSVISNGEPGVILITILIVVIGAVSLYKDYEILNQSKGFVKKLITSSIIFTVISVAVFIAPEGHDSKTAVILYLAVPAWLLAYFLVFNSKQGKFAYKLWSIEYDKKYNK